MDTKKLQNLIEQQQLQINQLLQSNVTLQNQVTQLLNYVSSLPSPAAVPPAPPVRKSPVSMPEKFSGQMDMFPAFLGQCQLFMSLRPEDFPNDRARTGFILSLLSGQAAKWATPLLVQDSPLLDNFQGFLQQIRVMFENPIKSQTVDRRLRDITQGKRSLQEYVAEFRVLCLDSNWNEPAHMAAFQEGLSDAIKDELVHAERALTLDALIVQCLRIEARLQQRGRKRLSMEPSSFFRAQPTPPRVFQPIDMTEEPLELGALRPRLTAQERSRRFQEGLCLYCGGLGHFVNSCNRRGNRRPVPETTLGSSGKQRRPDLKEALGLVRFTSRPRTEPVTDTTVVGIYDSRWKKGRFQYFVGRVENETEIRHWQDVTKVHAPDLVRRYHAEFPSKPHPERKTRGTGPEVGDSVVIGRSNPVRNFESDDC